MLFCVFNRILYKIIAELIFAKEPMLKLGARNTYATCNTAARNLNEGNDCIKYNVYTCYVLAHIEFVCIVEISTVATKPNDNDVFTNGGIDNNCRSNICYCGNSDYVKGIVGRIVLRTGNEVECCV